MKTKNPSIPNDLKTAPRKSPKKLLAVFRSMPPSHQREYINWICEAKRKETRDKRIKKAMKMITK
ncbi:MAG: YdeI/OmpD-associated family protein [Patescibacteria group bacterium]